MFLNRRRLASFKYLNFLLIYNLQANNLTTFYNPNVGSTPHISIFGDTLTAKRNTQINILFSYSLPPDKVITDTTTTGTATVSYSMACIRTGTDTTGSASIKSRAAVQYVPGHEVEYLFTAIFTTGVPNSTQWIGAFNDQDGFAIGFNGATFAVFHRNSLATNTIIDQKDFNVDRLDGAGPSGLTLNYHNLNIFKISFGWLGSAPISFWVMRDDGHWFKFHVIKRPNHANVPSLKIPMLQMKAEVKNLGNTSNLKLCTASWMGGTIGTDDATIVRIYDYARLNVPIGGSPGGAMITKPVLTIRNKATYQGQTNYLQLKILFVNVTSETGNVLTTFRGIKNGTLTGTNWSDYATDRSIAEVDTSATAISSGTAQLSIFGSNDSSTNQPILANHAQIVLLPGDTFTITAAAPITATVNASLTWQESAA